MKRSRLKPSEPVWSTTRRLDARGRADAALVLAYCSGRDVAARPAADAAWIPFDVMTNRAHCAMLAAQGIIPASALATIAEALDRIERRWRAGRFALDPSLEDAHMNVESAVARLGGARVAALMHTGRSRNDQAATDARLWLREKLLSLLEALSATVVRLATLARREARTVMAGWTHGQPAMPTTLGHWAAAHGTALARDLTALRDLWPVINVCPLGAAAGFGTAWPIDRSLTARLLGFDAPQPNSLDAVSTRWEPEARVAAALAVMMNHLSSLGQDLIRLASPPAGHVQLSPAFTTGSSIMPQKRNPDFAEVTRARAAAVHALLGALLEVGRAALSGYNRDVQWTKTWMMEIVEAVEGPPAVFDRALATLTVDRRSLAGTAGADFSTSTDLADYLSATRAAPFREVYRLVAEAVRRDRAADGLGLATLNEQLAAAGLASLTPAEFQAHVDPAAAVARRRSLGGPAPEQTRRQAAQLRRSAAEARRWVAAQRRRLAAARVRLTGLIDRLTHQAAGRPRRG